MKYLALVLLLTGCNSLYITELPEGMELTETHYTDQQALYAACGKAVPACVMTDHKTYCNIHIPLAANGEPIERYRMDELNHCAGGRHLGDVI